VVALAVGHSALADNGWGQSARAAERTVVSSKTSTGQTATVAHCVGISSSGSTLDRGERIYGELSCMVHFVAKRPFPESVQKVTYVQTGRTSYRLTDWRVALVGGTWAGTCRVNGRVLYLESVSCVSATRVLVTFESGSLKGVHDLRWACNGNTRRGGSCTGPPGSVAATNQGFAWL